MRVVSLPFDIMLSPMHDPDRMSEWAILPTGKLSLSVSPGWESSEPSESESSDAMASGGRVWI